MTALIASILPVGVRYAEAFDDAVPAPLFPAEERLLTGAKAKRRGEFATARRCARDALGELGIAPAPLLRGPGGAPAWPPGVLGSLTHCAGYRAAVVARCERVRVLGIDAEPAIPLPDGVLGLVTSPGERAALAALAPDVHWDRLLFCAKEAVYKAWFPITGTWLGFRDATVEFDSTGAFRAVVRAPGGPGGFTGRWLAGDGLLLAAVTA